MTADPLGMDTVARFASIEGERVLARQARGEHLPWPVKVMEPGWVDDRGHCTRCGQGFPHLGTCVLSIMRSGVAWAPPAYIDAAARMVGSYAALREELRGERERHLVYRPRLRVRIEPRGFDGGWRWKLGLVGGKRELLIYLVQWVARFQWGEK